MGAKYGRVGKALILLDGRNLPVAGWLEEPEDLESKFTRAVSGVASKLECACGSTAFEVKFPQWVCTTAKCIKCGQEEIVHDG